MKKILRQVITNKTKKMVIITTLLLSIVLMFSFSVNDVAAVQVGSDNATAPSENLTVSDVQTTSNSSNSTTSNLSSSSDSKKNQTLPDPVIYNGGVPVSRGGQPAGHNWGTIQNAIIAAQSGDTIMLEDGATFNEYGLIISKNLDFRVFNNGHATINGNNMGIIFTINPGIIVNMYNLTIINGYGTYSGGGILNMGTLTVNNCTFSGNRAKYGGAIYTETGSTLHVIGTTFSGNSAQYGANGYGSAIYSYYGTADVTGCTFTGNIASDYGGAIENYGGTMTVTGCTFTGNIAGANGGAIENGYGGFLSVNNSTFIGNTAVGKTPYSDGNGGAIDNYYSTAWVNNSTFRGNSAHYGGAIFNDVTGILHVTSSTFGGPNASDKNTAGYGAGVYNYHGTADVTGSHFTGNSVTGDGGAIENYDGALTVTGSDFTGNIANANGGAIYNVYYGGGSLTANENIFIGNTAGATGGAIYNNGGSVVAHFNRIVGNSNYSIYSNGGSVNAENNWWGTNFQGTNPVTAGYINSNVDADPWVVLRINGAPDLIGTGETSTLSVNLNYNSNGENLLAVYGKSVPDASVVFNAGSLGSLSTLSGVISNGLNVTTIFTAGSTPAISVVNATVDNQSLSAVRIMDRDNLYVATAADGGSDSTGNGSPDHPFLTFNTAIAELRAGGRIHVAKGVYNGSLNRGLTINKSMTIFFDAWRGTGAAIINAENSDRIFSITSGVTVILQNLTLTNGNANSGGAIYNQGTLTVIESEFTGNTAPSTVNGQGNGGAIDNPGNLTIYGCNFRDNTSRWAGGAIESSGSLTVTDSMFTGNHASHGGAIHNYMGTLDVENTDFIGNTVQYNGGAIHNQGTLTVTGCTFTGNTATYYGGAIFNYQSTSTVHFSRIVGNTADQGNAIYNNGGTVNATLNWWGSNVSPAGNVEGNVLFDPWIVLTITANPTTIDNGGNSQITADLLHDSNGLFHDPALGHVPDIPLTLNIPWGSFTNPGTTHSIIENTVNGAINPVIFYANEGAVNPLYNPVKVTATADGYTTNNTESAYIAINGVANISITKTSPATVIAGNQLTYTITITNSGIDSAEGVTLDDNVPLQSGTLQYRFKVNDDAWSSWTSFINSLHLDLGAIESGKTAVIEIIGTVDPSTPKDTVITNTATANTTTTPGPKAATTTTTVDTQADLVVSKTGPTTVNAGNQITYTIIVTNIGPSDARNVQIQDIIPEILQNVTHDLFNLGTISAGQSKTVIITGTVPSSTDLGTVMENSATVTSDTSGTITQSGTVQTIVNTQSNLNVVKESLSQVIAGMTYTDPIYRITVTNNGPSDARNVQVQDNIPSQIVNREYRINGGAWISFSGDLDQLISYLGGGASSVIEVRGRIPSSTPAGSMTNMASASVYGNTFNSDPVITEITSSTNVSLNQIVDKTRPNVGDTVIFTVKVRNNGLSDAINIRIGDLMPSDFVDVIVTSSKGTYAGGVWTLDLASGEEATLTLSGKVTAIMAGKNTTNTALLQGSTDLANATIYVPKSDLYIKITASKDNPKVGETFTITYKLGNKGPDIAENVTITIPLPECFEISNISGDGNWTYNANINTITWTLANVPVGDPYLYISGKVTKAGTYVFSSSISSETYNINSESVTPVTINAVAEVKAASKTIPMQKTGLPLAGLILAVLAVFGGLVISKRKI